MKKLTLIIVIVSSFMITAKSQPISKVGTLPGEFGVSPSGAAIYSIPIDIPSGRAGLDPDLAFIYNSQSGTNIMGESWNVSGFSSIVRESKNMYYNNTIKTIDFLDDEFLLDGAHLIKIKETDSEVEYRTEIDEFSKIIFYKPSSDNIHGYFIVYHKAGTIAEYGYTNNSKHIYEDDIQGANPALAWHICKLYDRKGNYITYKYDQDQNTGELHPLFIYYTGFQSNNLKTTGSYEVAFYYDTYSDSSRSVIYNQYRLNDKYYPYKIQNIKRLKSVEISYNSNPFKKYDLTYYSSQEMVSASGKDFLKSIKLLIPYTTEQLNETEFTWDFYNPDYKGFFLEELDNYRQSRSKIFTLDILGTNTETYAVYRAPYAPTLGNNVISIANQDIPVNGSCLDCNIEMSSIDFDLNGDDELIFLDGDGIYIYDYIRNVTGYTFNKVYNYSFSGKYRVGDFTGDKVPDILLVGDDVKILVGSYSGVGYLNFTLNSNVIGLYPGSTFETVADINGDQILDIVLKNNFSFSIYTFSLSEGFKLRNSYLVSLTTNGNAAFFADANGDSRTDIIYFENGRKYIHFSYGYHFFTDQGDFEEMEIPFLVEDLNNDGRADFLFIQIGQIRTKLVIYYTLPNGINSAKRISEFAFQTDLFESEIDLCSGDLDANGIKDIIIGFYEKIPEDQNEHLRLALYTFQDQGLNKNVITDIIDGHGVSRIIKYKNYPRSEFVIANFPVCKYRNKDILVMESYISGPFNNKSGELRKWDLKKYVFEKPIVHLTGKGFLGFQEKSISSFANTSLSDKAVVNKSIDLLYSSGEKYFFMYTHTNEISIGDKVISSTINSFDIKQTQDNSLCFLPVITQSSTLSYENDTNHTFKGISIFKQSLANIDKFGNSLESETIMDEVATNPLTSDYSWKKTIRTKFNNIESEWLISRPGSTEIISFHKPEELNIPAEDRVITNYIYYDGVLEPANYIKYLEVIPNYNNTLKNEIWFTYDMFGNIISRKNKALVNGVIKERIIEYEYRDDLIYEGRFLTSEIVKTGNPEEDIITKYDYYLSSGLLKSKTVDDKNNLTTTYYYDKFGKLIKSVNPDLTSDEIIYNWVQSGNCEVTPPDSSLYYILKYKKVKSTEQEWNKEYGFFDKYGRNICNVSFGMQGVVNAVYNKFDGLGRLYSTSEPYRYSSSPALFNTISYDFLGRIVSRKLSSGVDIVTSFKGRNTLVTNTSANVYKETTVNMIGLPVITKESDNGILNYDYDARGKIRAIYPRTSSEECASTTEYDYDDAGNLIRVTDPDAGVALYTYNAFGEVVSQSDDKGAFYLFSYDNIGRLVSTENVSPDDETVKYYYGNNKLTNGFGNIEQIEKSFGGNITLTSFTYDNLKRLSTKSESIDGNVYKFNYEYNEENGALKSYEYPSGLKLLYLYDEYGYLSQIMNNTTQESLWKAGSANEFGQLTSMAYGDNLIVDNYYDGLGYINCISAWKPNKGIEEVIQYLTYTFDLSTGNLMKRTDEIQHLSETFNYDPVLKSRLTSWQVGADQYTVSYERNGNIINKSDVTAKDGVFNYNPNKIHQVIEIKSPTLEYSNRAKDQLISYNGFNKVKSIKQQIGLVQVELKFQYGTNNERIKTVLTTQGTPLETRYYFGDYETKKTGSGPIEKLHYLYASDGLFAIIKQSDQIQQTFYILKDHQGSYNLITDKDGNTIERLSFDPWGRRRNATTWSYTNAPAYATFSRGYTGHEHLDNFGLINMNGRMYDPSLGRFLSADPILQNPTSLQGHNRYSYVLNNPLKYTDPSGYKVKPAGWDAPWEYSAYVNFGPKGGSLSGNYWAVDYRTTEGNWAAMSQTTFDNLYGTGKYEDCYEDIRLNLAISNAAPGDFTTLYWNPVGGREVSREYTKNGLNIYYEGSWSWTSNGKYTGRKYSRADDSGEDDGLNTFSYFSTQIDAFNVATLRMLTKEFKAGGDVLEIAKSVKAITRLGKLSTTLNISSVVYEVSSGNVHFSTITDVLMIGGGVLVGIAVGPITAGLVGLGYGGVMLFGGQEALNDALDGDWNLQINKSIKKIYKR